MVVTRVVVLALAAVAAVVLWKALAPANDKATDAVAGQVLEALDTATTAGLTAAEVNLRQQQTLSGTFAGAAMPPGTVLVWADASRYCIQAGAGARVAHLVGPGGAATPGACPR